MWSCSPSWCHALALAACTFDCNAGMDRARLPPKIGTAVHNYMLHALMHSAFSPVGTSTPSLPAVRFHTLTLNYYTISLGFMLFTTATATSIMPSVLCSDDTSL